eukprot:1439472-Lingulodinium_polyedra.AAC.1
MVKRGLLRNHARVPLKHGCRRFVAEKPTHPSSSSSPPAVRMLLGRCLGAALALLGCYLGVL